MALPAEKQRYTFADCLTWGEDKRIELIDGELSPSQQNGQQKARKNREEEYTKLSSSREEVCFKKIRGEPIESGMRTQGVVKALNVGKYMILSHGACRIVRQVD